MKRRIMLITALLCFFLLAGNPLYADADIAGSESTILPDGTKFPVTKIAELNFSLDFGSLPPVADIGFSSDAVNDFDSVIKTNIDKVSLVTDITEGKFSNQSEATKVFLYWRLLSGKNPVPTINLKMDGPMKNAQVQNAAVDWTVSWVTDFPNKNTSYSINSKDTLVAEVVFEGSSSTSTLNKKFGSLELVMKTDTPYWLVPSAAYSAELTVEIIGV